MSDEHFPQLLHQRVRGAGGIVHVRKRRRVFHYLEQLLLKNPWSSSSSGLSRGLDRQRLLGRLLHGLPHSSLHVLLQVPQIHRLAEGHQKGRRHELQDLDGLGRLARGHKPQRIHVLVVLLRALHVRGHRIRQIQQLGTVGRHGDLRSLEPVVQARVRAPRQVGRQSAVVEVVHQLRHLREHELPDGAQRQAHVVHGHPDGRTLEIASVQSLVPGHIDERVVVHGVYFPLDRVRGSADHFDLRPQPLRGRAQSVAVLLGLLQRVGLVQFGRGFHVRAALQHPLHDGGGLDLARMMLQLVRQMVGEFRLALHGLAEQGRRDLGQHGQDVGVVARHAGLRRAHGRAVHQRQPFLGHEFEGLEQADLLQGLVRREGLAARVHASRVGAAREHAGDVRERHQVARGRDGAAEGQLRGQVLVQELLHGLQNVPADARVALHERVGAHQHGRAGGGHRQQHLVAAQHSGIEEPDELALQLDSLVRAAMGGGAEARGHSVGVGALHHVVGDPVGALVHSALGAGRIEHHGHVGIASHGRDLADGQRHALDRHLLGMAELLHHVLHFLPVATLHAPGRLRPVQRVPSMVSDRRLLGHGTQAQLTIHVFSLPIPPHDRSIDQCRAFFLSFFLACFLSVCLTVFFRCR
ncbi:hypothetical protein Mapa_015160 [Marchantia paleacea]|nr:hypothetical protein Mapa_015160 [Marchantia paleacea]